MSLLVALALLAADAGAKPLALAVRYRDGTASFTEEFRVKVAESMTTSGTLKGSDGSRRTFTASLLPTVDSGGVVDTQLLFSFQPSGGSDATTLMLQGSVLLKRGEALTLLDCGRWKVELGLAPLGEPAAGFGAERGNQRVTTALSGGGESFLCRLTVEGDMKSNFFLAFGEDEEAPRVDVDIKTVLLAGRPSVRYRVEHRPRAGAPWRLKGTAALTPGERADVPGSEGRLGLLFEGTEAAWEMAARYGSSESPPRSKPVLAAKPTGPWTFSRYSDAFVAFDLPGGWTVTHAGDSGEHGYGFNIQPPASLPWAQAAAPFCHANPVDRAKDAPDGDYGAMLARALRKADSPQWVDERDTASRSLVAPARVKVKGGSCFGVVNEFRASECEYMNEGARVARGDCYSANYYADCVSEQGVRLAIHSPLGFGHAQAGQLTDSERDMLALAERRVKSFEFTGRVPRNSFVKPKARKK